MKTYTQAEFNSLPPLLTRSEFLDWTGMRSQDLSAAVKSGQINSCRLPGRKKLRYLKSEVARLGNLTL